MISFFILIGVILGVLACMGMLAIILDWIAETFEWPKSIIVVLVLCSGVCFLIAALLRGIS
jgi:hypothetical protein